MGEEKHNRVLLVDDDREVLMLNGEYLRRKGFEVLLAENAAEALNLLKENAPDCIVLDVMMPETDGFEALGSMKKHSDAPILLLTGRTQEEDRIRGLTQGAEDYITKPCSLEELALRIKIHISRHRPAKGRKDVMEFPPLRIDLLSHKVFCKEEEIPLSNREYELLVCLAKHSGEVMTFEQIGKELLGGYIEADRRNIMMNTSRLRKKLEGYVGMEDMIGTVWGKGYCFHGHGMG